MRANDMETNMMIKALFFGAVGGAIIGVLIGHSWATFWIGTIIGTSVLYLLVVLI